MRRTVLTFAVAIAMSATACAATEEPATDDGAGVPSERQQVIDDFAAGIAGSDGCAELFALRNQLDPDDVYIESTMNPELQRIQCFGSSSQRGDKPTTTTLQEAQDRSAFNAFMKAALVGTSYSYGEPGTPAADISPQVYENAAETICEQLRGGADEALLRAEKAEDEELGDPELDREIPIYLDAIFEAARRFICPDV